MITLGFLTLITTVGVLGFLYGKMRYALGYKLGYEFGKREMLQCIAKEPEPVEVPKLKEMKETTVDELDWGISQWNRALKDLPVERCTPFRFPETMQ